MNMMFSLSRRSILQLAGGAATLPLTSGLLGGTAHAASGTLTIAYNVNLPSFDPTVGLSAVNPTIQSIYQSVFDPYIGQAPDLSFKPGLLTKWGWNDDRSKITLEVRKGATWHDGSPVAPEDVVWSLERAADPKSGNPIQFVWSKVGNYKIDGNTITGDVKEFEPTLFKWMAFLTGYVLPKSLLREGRRRRVREGADRIGALQGRRVRAQRVPAAKGAFADTGAPSRPSRPWCSSSSPTPPAASPKWNPAARI